MVRVQAEETKRSRYSRMWGWSLLLIWHVKTHLLHLYWEKRVLFSPYKLHIPRVQVLHYAWWGRSLLSAAVCAIYQQFSMLWGWLLSEGLPNVFFCPGSSPALSYLIRGNWPQSLHLGVCHLTWASAVWENVFYRSVPSALGVCPGRELTALRGYFYPW